jgi:multicomponent Na+:H+ antiporter subunit E
VIVRFAGFYAFWVVLIGAAPLDLAAGFVASAGATWTSLALHPPTVRRLRFAALPGTALAFLRKSLLAGFDVATRALGPRVRVDPGLLEYRVGFPRGRTRNAFAMYTSLMPGTVPCEDREDVIVYHCLDRSQPVAADLAEEERRIAGVMSEARRG